MCENQKKSDSAKKSILPAFGCAQHPKAGQNTQYKVRKKTQPAQVCISAKGLGHQGVKDGRREAVKSHPNCFCIIYSRLSRHSTARGSSSGFSLVSPTKVEACKSFLFPCIENKEHLVDFCCHTLFLYHFASMPRKWQSVKGLRMTRSLVKLSGPVKSVT